MESGFRGVFDAPMLKIFLDDMLGKEEGLLGGSMRLTMRPMALRHPRPTPAINQEMFKKKRDFALIKRRAIDMSCFPKTSGVLRRENDTAGFGDHSSQFKDSTTSKGYGVGKSVRERVFDATILRHCVANKSNGDSPGRLERKRVKGSRDGRFLNKRGRLGSKK